MKRTLSTVVIQNLLTGANGNLHIWTNGADGTLIASSDKRPTNGKAGTGPASDTLQTMAAIAS